MQKITVTAKAGFKINVTVDGFRTKPVIRVDAFSVGNKHVAANKAVLVPTGIRIAKSSKNPAVVVRCDNSAVKAALAELPEEPEKVLKLKTKIIDADGDKVEVTYWDFAGAEIEHGVRIDGYKVTCQRIESVLNKQGITEITVSKLEKLLADKLDIAALKASASVTASKTMAMLRDEEDSQFSSVLR